MSARWRWRAGTAAACWTVKVAFVTAICLVGRLAGAPATGGLSLPEKRGKQIYLRGAGPEGREIVSFLGDPPMEVPGSLMACANCHGYDGRGKPEGGVTPSDITWEALTKSYGVTHESGRKHPAYDGNLVARAIEAGLDPAGNKLHLAMPRFRLTAGDMDDLIAYMKRLGRDLDPGLTEERITVGTFVPGSGRLVDTGRAMEDVLTAFFDDLNGQGGIYSRKIDLKVAHCAETAGETVTAFERFVEEQSVFALVGAFIAGAEKQIAALLEAREVPLVGPSTLYPAIGYPINRHVFYLLSGLSEQSRALTSFAAGNLQLGQNPRVGIVYPESELATEAVAAIEEECSQRGWRSLSRYRYPQGGMDAAGLVGQLSAGEPEIVFFLGSAADAVAIASEAGRTAWKPNILYPGSLAGKEILQTPADFKGKLYLSFPVLPSDQTEQGLAEFREFSERHKIVREHMAVQFTAYCAAKVFVQGLKLAGRDLSREKLITALEGMYKYDTGLMPPVTFGPNRRIGALGAHVTTVDAERGLVPATGWIEAR